MLNSSYQVTTFTESHLRMEENFWTKESLVSHINCELLLGDAVNSCVLFDVFAGLAVELVELLCDVGTHVTISFLDCLGCLQ